MRSVAIALACLAVCGGLSSPVPTRAQAATDAPAAASVVRLQGRFVPLRAMPGDTPAPVGEVRLAIEADGDVRVDLVVSGMTERATSATLHVGSGGESTGQVARLAVTPDGNVVRVVGGTVGLSPLVAAQLRSGDGFVVLRTSEHRDGYLRAALAVRAPALDDADVNAP